MKYYYHDRTLLWLRLQAAGNNRTSYRVATTSAAINMVAWFLSEG